MNFCSYHRPTSLTELYLLLERERNTPLFLSGGTDILVQDRANGKYVGRAVYDLTALPELKEIRRNDDTLLIGGEVTHSAVANSPLVFSWPDLWPLPVAWWARYSCGTGPRLVETLPMPHLLGTLWGLWRHWMP